MRVSTLLAPVVLTGLVVLAACSGGRTEGPATTPAEGETGAAVHLDEHRTLGTPLTVGNLRVWPVHTDAPLDVGDFLTLSEAQEAGVAKVREVGGGASNAQAAQVLDVQVDVEEAAERPANELDETVAQGVRQVVAGLNGSGGATVGTLVVENTGDRPILILAGTIVKGGNQDRQLGQDVVVDAGATVPVEAFCVEQGRWSGQREGVATAGEFVALDAVTNYAARKGAQYAKDQGAVWREVAAARQVAFAGDGPAPAAESDDRVRELEQALADGGADEERTAELVEEISNLRALGFIGQARGGSTLVDVLEKVDPEVAQRREETAAAVVAHFAALAEGADAPVGFAYAIGAEPVTVRTFAHARLLAKHLETFANSMALDASLADAAEATCGAADVVAMVLEISQAAENRTETGASNALGVRDAKAGWNGNCYVDVDGDGRDEALTQDWTRR